MSVSCRGAGCGGRYDAGLRNALPQAGRTGENDRQNGRTAQVHVRVVAYTNGEASAVATPPGTCSKPQSPSACGTQAKYLLPGRAAFLRRKGKVAPPFALNEQRLPCAVSTGCQVCRLRAGRPGAAGAVKRQAFRTPLRGRRKAGMTGGPQPERTGAMTCVWSSDARRARRSSKSEAGGCLIFE